jgi:hypothetical protein
LPSAKVVLQGEFWVQTNAKKDWRSKEGNPKAILRIGIQGW